MGVLIRYSSSIPRQHDAERELRQGRSNRYGHGKFGNGWRSSIPCRLTFELLSLNRRHWTRSSPNLCRGSTPNEGPDDSVSHTKTSLIGASVTIPITDGRLTLGTWQSVYLCEFRKLSHKRKIVATTSLDRAANSKPSSCSLALRLCRVCRVTLPFSDVEASRWLFREPDDSMGWCMAALSW